MWRVAVAASLVAAAFAAGRLTAPRTAVPANDDQKFAFLLYGGAASGGADDRAAEALNLARQHPHATSGTVVVRPIDTP